MAHSLSSFIAGLCGLSSSKKELWLYACLSSTTSCSVESAIQRAAGLLDTWVGGAGDDKKGVPSGHSQIVILPRRRSLHMRNDEGAIKLSANFEIL